MFYYSKKKVLRIKKMENKIVGRKFVLMKELIGVRLHVINSYRKVSFMVKDYMLGFKAGFFDLTKRKIYERLNQNLKKKQSGRNNKQGQKVYTFGLKIDDKIKKERKRKLKKNKNKKKRLKQQKQKRGIRGIRGSIKKKKKK